MCDDRIKGPEKSRLRRSWGRTNTVPSVSRLWRNECASKLIRARICFPERTMWIPGRYVDRLEPSFVLTFCHFGCRESRAILFGKELLRRAIDVTSTFLYIRIGRWASKPTTKLDAIEQTPRGCKELSHAQPSDLRGVLKRKSPALLTVSSVDKAG